jgi:hypothetical protein
MAKSSNRLLASLPADAFSAISPHLKIVELKFGAVLAEAGSPIRQVYFPYSGAISLVVDLDVGMMIETAMVGRDGVMNAASALDGKVSLNKGVVQVAGSAGTLEVNLHVGEHARAGSLHRKRPLNGRAEAGSVAFDSTCLYVSNPARLHQSYIEVF